MTNEIDYTLKLLIVGDTNVGKTTFFNKIRNNRAYFSGSTIGVDFTNMYYTIRNKPVKLIVWDTAGQERFNSIVRSYFRDTCGIILMIDVSKPDTYKKIEGWLKSWLHEQICSHTHPILLLGNKCDLLHQPDTTEIDRLIQQYNVSYREISCKDDTQLHLEEIFTSFIGEIMDCEYIDDCQGIKKKGADRSSITLMDKFDSKPSIKSENCCNIV
jgi:small GTP-binding protein